MAQHREGLQLPQLAQCLQEQFQGATQTSKWRATFKARQAKEQFAFTRCVSNPIVTKNLYSVPDEVRQDQECHRKAKKRFNNSFPDDNRTLSDLYAMSVCVPPYGDGTTHNIP